VERGVYLLNRPTTGLEALREDYEGEAGRKDPYRRYDELGRWTRAQISAEALEALAEERYAAPTVTTFSLPSPSFPRECLSSGFRIAHESEYLRSRQWGQIATMGNLDRQALEPQFASLQRPLSHATK
jgi:aspartate aminotransferase-like enzyme